VGIASPVIATAAPLQPALDAPAEAAPIQITATPDTLAAETALMTEAQGLMRGGEATAALAVLDRYSVQYPHGAYVPDLMALRAIALCALHRDGEARDAQAAFEHAWPHSPLASHVRSACGAQP
jgi:hypothetical protein